MIETLDMAKIISIDNGLIQDEEGCINNRDVCNKNFSQKFKNAQTILQDWKLQKEWSATQGALKLGVCFSSDWRILDLWLLTCRLRSSSQELSFGTILIIYVLFSVLKHVALRVYLWKISKESPSLTDLTNAANQLNPASRIAWSATCQLYKEVANPNKTLLQKTAAVLQSGLSSNVMQVESSSARSLHIVSFSHATDKCFCVLPSATVLSLGSDFDFVLSKIKSSIALRQQAKIEVSIRFGLRNLVLTLH